MSFSASYKIWLLKADASGLINATRPGEQRGYDTITIETRAQPPALTLDSLKNLQISFEPSGRFVIVAERYDTPDQVDKSTTMRSAYELSHNGMPEARFLAEFLLEGDWAMVPPLFHPTLPVLVLLSPSTRPLAAERLYFWNYKQGKLIQMYLSQLYSNIFTAEDEGLHSVFTSILREDDMQISDCGTYIVSKSPGGGPVVVTPIPPEVLTRSANGITNETASTPHKSRAADVEPLQPLAGYSSGEGRESHLQLHSLGAGRIVGLPTTTVTADSALLSTHKSADGLQLEITRGDGSATDVIELSALPAWLSSMETSAHVRLPESAHDSMKIVIHKADASSRGGSLLPLIIERDPRFVRKPQAHLTGGDGEDLDLDDANSDGNVDEAEASDWGRD